MNVVGFVDDLNNFQDLLTCAVDDGQPVVPQITQNDGAPLVTFCSVTTLQNKQHTLAVTINSNGVNNVLIDKFHIFSDSPAQIPAPQPSTSLVEPTTSLSSSEAASQTDGRSESGLQSSTGSISQISSSSGPLAPSPPTSVGNTPQPTETSSPPPVEAPAHPNPVSSPTSTSSSGQLPYSLSASRSASSTSSSNVLPSPLVSNAPSAHTNTGAIIGGLFGGIFTLVILLAALVCFRRRLRVMNRQSKCSSSHSNTSPADQSPNLPPHRARSRSESAGMAAAPRLSAR